MILGKGLIASAFIQSRFDSPYHIIFASGVSNSTETDPKSYLRELELIEQYFDKNTTFVYFSTTSIFDPTKQDSIYINHKKYIENLIQAYANSFLIVRLPIMLGYSSNPNTLINYLVSAIKNSYPIELHAKACRHLLDIDDLVPQLLPYFHAQPIRKQINILGSEKITIPDLIHKIEEKLNKKGNYTWLEAGACYEVPENMGECIFILDTNYHEKILKKYIQ